MSHECAMLTLCWCYVEHYVGINVKPSQSLQFLAAVALSKLSLRQKPTLLSLTMKAFSTLECGHTAKSWFRGDDLLFQSPQDLHPNRPGEV